MNIQGYVSAWRPSNINYAATQTENNNAKDSTFSSILNSKKKKKQMQK